MTNEMKFCQSCSMPLQEDSQLGTEKDGGKSADYCSYCYQNGQFTSECTMEEMVDLCAPPMAEANAGMSVEEAKAKMMEFFPQLKRWAQ